MYHCITQLLHDLYNTSLVFPPQTAFFFLKTVTLISCASAVTLHPPEQNPACYENNDVAWAPVDCTKFLVCVQKISTLDYLSLRNIPLTVGRENVVGVVTRCTLDGLGIEFWRKARISVT